MTEDNRINFRIKAQAYNVKSTKNSAQEVLDFIEKHGDDYTNAELISWLYYRYKKQKIFYYIRF